MPITSAKDPPPLLHGILHGLSVSGHEGHPLDHPPEWLDKEKYKRGQQFCRKYLLPVLLGNFFSMMSIFVWPPIFKVILYTRSLETIPKAFRRTFLTMAYFKSWYLGDIYDQSDEAYRNMRKVQELHRKWASAVGRDRDKVRTNKADTSREPGIEALCTTWPETRRNMACYNPPVQQLPAPDDPCYMSQVDHAITVLGIITPVLLSPEKLGIHGATKQDLEGYAHLWRVLTYHLEIQDQFNPCSGNLYLVQARCQELLDSVVYPAFQNMTKETEYILRVVVESTLNTTVPTSYLSAEAITLYMGWCTNDIDMKVFRNMVGWHGWFHYWLLRYMFQYLLRIPFVVNIFNYYLQSKEREIKSQMKDQY